MSFIFIGSALTSEAIRKINRLKPALHFGQTNTGWPTVISVVGHAPTPCDSIMAIT
jgi:hypothetical protein